MSDREWTVLLIAIVSIGVLAVVAILKVYECQLLKEELHQRKLQQFGEQPKSEQRHEPIHCQAYQCFFECHKKAHQKQRRQA